MYKLTVYPIGNADCTLFSFGTKHILYDFANTGSDDACDLPTWLREDLGEADTIDIVAFSHSDSDHVTGAKDFFFMDHVKKYQGDDRVRMAELWVPADMITDKYPDEDHSAHVLRLEAQGRLKEGKGIKVFSRPDRLEEWLENHNLTVEERKNCIVDAGQLVPDLSLDSDGVEVFTHAPFSKIDGEEIKDKNTNSLVHQLTIQTAGKEFKVLMCADAEQASLDGIIDQTKVHRNENRLEWDILKIPHHCSYKSLNKNEKGKKKTIPTDSVKWLLEQGITSSRMIITSEEIPSKDTTQPPHFQAHATYSEHAGNHGGDVIVTMENPEKRTVIEFGKNGHTHVRNTIAAAGLTVATTKTSPRFGRV